MNKLVKFIRILLGKPPEPVKDRWHLWKAIWDSAEGKIFVYTILSIIILLSSLFTISFWFPVFAQKILAMTSTHLIFGRAASMSLGYALGVSSWFVIPHNFLMETLMVTFFYPLFVLGYEKLVVTEFLRKWIEKIRKIAYKRQNLIRKYGIIGLVFFVWLPFWMTGPVMAAIIGYLIGMELRVIMSVVLVGTGIAVITWAFLIRGLHMALAQVTPVASFIILGMVILFIFTTYIVQFQKFKRFKRKR